MNKTTREQAKQVIDDLLQFKNQYECNAQENLTFSQDSYFSNGINFAIGYAIGSIQKTFLEKDNEQEE